MSTTSEQIAQYRRSCPAERPPPAKHSAMASPSALAVDVFDFMNAFRIEKALLFGF
jgi:hypothetical protein